MDIKKRKDLEELLLTWRKAIHDCQTRMTNSTEVYASWQGEAKAYNVASEDVKKLMNEPENNISSASQSIINQWSQQTELRLGYLQEHIDELPDDEIEREKSVETLKQCANQLISVLQKVE